MKTNYKYKRPRAIFLSHKKKVDICSLIPVRTYVRICVCRCHKEESKMSLIHIEFVVIVGIYRKTAYVLYLIRKKSVFFWSVVWIAGEWVNVSYKHTHNRSKYYHKQRQKSARTKIIMMIPRAGFLYVWTDESEFRFVLLYFWLDLKNVYKEEKSEQKFCVCSVFRMQFNTDCADLAQHQWMVHKIRTYIPCICIAHVPIERKSEWFV